MLNLGRKYQNINEILNCIFHFSTLIIIIKFELSIQLSKYYHYNYLFKFFWLEKQICKNTPSCVHLHFDLIQILRAISDRCLGDIRHIVKHKLQFSTLFPPSALENLLLKTENISILPFNADFASLPFK